MNKFDSKKPLLYQLTYPQLYYVYEITKSLENKKTLSLLNNESLRYRKKLKFPNKNINYYKNNELYIYTSNTDGLNVVQPYKDQLYQYSNVSNTKKNSNILYNIFLEYIKNNDLIGADMTRKFIQSLSDVKNYNNKLKLIQQNKSYLNWIESFNWKNKDPYNPNTNKYII
jgi:hypothetical protein